MVVFGYNDLGMHCMNQDFSEMMILPPANTLHAQVVDRSGEEPRIVTGGVTVHYSVPGNTTSVTKTNFWQYATQLFGVSLAPDMGLFGFGLAGDMVATAAKDYAAFGVPLTPITDSGQEDPFQLASITVSRNGKEVAQTHAVIPVSWEINCNLCHNTAGISTATDILRKHDQKHGTSLETQKPVVCGTCHAQPELNLPGQPGVPSLSSSIHTSHASRMDAVKGIVSVGCYACHPGLKTQCLRDVHAARGMDCNSCHTSMLAVGDPSRRPWVDEPKCGTCHQRKGFEFEQADTLYRNSHGHMGINCESCHGSPHAITPTLTAADNVQAIEIQGHPGTINSCTVCHKSTPSDPFPHRASDD
jgi:hypothetical protein